MKHATVMASLALVITVTFAWALFWPTGSVSQPKLSPLAPEDVILAFGDSLTQGFGVDAGKGYPEQLAMLARRVVINAGISGETTAQGLVRLSKSLDEAGPALMIMLMGGNDILRGMSMDEARRNLATMIEMALSAGVQVVLIGVPERSLFFRSAPIYRELADRYDLVLEDELLADLLAQPSMKSDPIHLNAVGYREMALRIHALLQSHGAL